MRRATPPRPPPPTPPRTPRSSASTRRSRATLDADYAAELAQVPDGPAKDKGVRVGDEVASRPPGDPRRRRLERRSAAVRRRHDPGDYRLDAADFPAPVFTTWGQVTPVRARPRRPVPPTAAARAHERRLRGRDQRGAEPRLDDEHDAHTPSRPRSARSGRPPIQNFWNQIAETAAADHGSDLATTARLFAALDLSFADSAIAFYDAKYTYRLWRPVTAIRLADTDGNPQTVADPTWLPLAGNTAADPSYPGAHSTISAAGADVLASFYGDAEQFSVTSPALPGVTRSFASFSAAAEEAGLSRIYAGAHTRLDHVAGVKLGHDVAGYVMQHALLPAHDRSGKTDQALRVAPSSAHHLARADSRRARTRAAGPVRRRSSPTLPGSGRPRGAGAAFFLETRRKRYSNASPFLFGAARADSPSRRIPESRSRAIRRLRMPEHQPNTATYPWGSSLSFRVRDLGLSAGPGGTGGDWMPSSVDSRNDGAPSAAPRHLGPSMTPTLAEPVGASGEPHRHSWHT